MYNNKWIKTGQRGTRAEFTDADLFTTLILLEKEPMGRYKLQEELAISDSSSKSLLNFCKNKLFLKAQTGRAGHSLTTKGQKVVEMIKELILEHDSLNFDIFENLVHYYVILNKSNNSNSLISWKIRDLAVSYGADSILFLINEKGKIDFPEEELNLIEFYPDLLDNIKRLLNNSNKKENYILITAAKNLETARKSAIITSIRLNQELYDKILTFL